MDTENINTASYEQLKTLREQINQRIKEVERDTLQELQNRAAQFGYQLHKNGERPMEKPKAKYTDGNGNSWAGKGKRPAWLQTKLEEGHSLEDFAT